ncbi:helix-turn-helix domain-containing protein [Mycobacterium sp. BMJ-28]
MPATTINTAIPFEDSEALVPPPQLAKFLHTSEAVLAQERYRGVGIPYVRHGRRILYRVRDIRAYLDANTKVPGGD